MIPSIDEPRWTRAAVIRFVPGMSLTRYKNWVGHGVMGAFGTKAPGLRKAFSDMNLYQFAVMAAVVDAGWSPAAAADLVEKAKPMIRDYLDMFYAPSYDTGTLYAYQMHGRVVASVHPITCSPFQVAGLTVPLGTLIDNVIARMEPSK